MTAWFIDDFLAPFLVRAFLLLNVLILIIKLHLGLMHNVTLKMLTCLDIEVIALKDDL